MKALITDTEIVNLDIETRTLEAAGFSVSRAQAKTPEEVIAACKGYDAALVQYAAFTSEVFAALPDLKIISRYGIGIDSIDLDAAKVNGVWVSNVPIYGDDEVPTHALAMILALMRHLPFQDRAVRSGAWHFNRTGPIEPIGESTLGIVGMGRLGRHLARLALPMFSKVVGYDPLLPTSDWPSGIQRMELDSLVGEAHALSLHIPLTAATNHIIDRALLNKTRSGGAYLVNTARGGLVDLDAVIEALESGALRGAALDVLPLEPPSDHPIIHHPRVLITPHMAWYSQSSMRDLRTKYAENVAQWALTGKAPNAVVVGRAR